MLAEKLSSIEKSEYPTSFLLTIQQKIFIIFFFTFILSMSGLGEAYRRAHEPVEMYPQRIVVKDQNDEEYINQEKYKQNQFAVLGSNEKYIQPTITPMAQPSEEWGTAKQLDEHTWTVRVGDDQKIASAQELLTALNDYRQKHGRGVLSWDDKLAQYAQTRAAFFESSNNLDSHAGFLDYINNQDGFNKLGFAGLGENSSFGYKLEAVHMIEWIYAADEGHNANQLSSEWTYVGIGVSGLATDFVFGGKKL